MNIGGFQKFSLIDYPGKVSAIVFTLGCPFRCGYCHNPELLEQTNWPKPIDVSEILDFLVSRKSKLDAVVITGGEPTIQPDLREFMRTIKELGYLVKLDSNGSNPSLLKKLFDQQLVDYIAMDIKAPLHRYNDVAGAAINTSLISESISLIMSSGVNYEFRTTVVKDQLLAEDFVAIGKLLKGARRYFMQKFIPTKTVNPNFLTRKTYSDEEFEELRQLLLAYIDTVEVR